MMDQIHGWIASKFYGISPWFVVNYDLHVEQAETCQQLRENWIYLHRHAKD